MERKKLYDACQPTSPSREVLGIIANKWTILVLHIINCEKVRYSQIQRKIPGISQKVLTGVLRQLEENGIITRTIYPVVPPRVEYETTDLGKTLLESLQALQNWSEMHVPQILAARKAYNKYLT
jgi:DNA-binding HxlR family transcriptional regulator